MLIFAEGTIHRRVAGQERAASAAWFGPMVDSGFLQCRYIAAVGQRVFMVLSTPDHETVERRLNDLPVVRDGSVSFTTSRVTALRFS